MDVKVFFLSMYRDVVVGDLEHAWYLNCGWCSTPSHLLAINFTMSRYVWPILSSPGDLPLDRFWRHVSYIIVVNDVASEGSEEEFFFFFFFFFLPPLI